MSEEKRIYVVVAEQVEVTILEHYVAESLGTTTMVTQPAGRLAAQCAHVVSKMRVNEILNSKLAPTCFDAYTTIVLSARNNKELKLLCFLMEQCRMPHEVFYDKNREAYYGKSEVLTAVSTYPIEPERAKLILDHLPLWSPKCA